MFGKKKSSINEETVMKALSTVILTSMLARMLQDYTFELPADQMGMEPDVGVVVSPKPGLRLTATRQTIG